MTTTAGERRRVRTRAEQAHAEIRRDILRGALRPGQKLSPAGMAQNYGVSAGVVREALTRLTEQGLVVLSPMVGFTVTQISREDLFDLTSVRLDIEPLALRRSMENGDVEWRTQVVAAHFRLEQTSQFDDQDPPGMSEEWSTLHKAFHESLLSACGSRRLLEFAESLRDSSELYRRWSAPVSQSSERDLVGEHRAMFEAVQSGDVDLACRLLGDHIGHTTQLVLRHAP